MALAVDFDFIHRLEGRRVLRGYVPEPETSNSGVTIASGFDLGQRDADALRRLGIDDTLRAKLQPYLGLKKLEAVAFLDEHPLEITEEEAERLDLAFKGQMIESLISRFDAASAVPFDELEPQKQTVIASVAFQYGTALDRSTPNFWRQVTTGDWSSALGNLRAFGDDYRTRRNKEGDLLAEVIEV